MIYNAQMASLNMLVRCAALENAHYGIRINAVAPGCVRSVRARTEDKSFKGQLSKTENSEYLMEQAKTTPLLQYAWAKKSKIPQYIY